MPITFVVARDNPLGPKEPAIYIKDLVLPWAQDWTPAQWQEMMTETQLNPGLRGTQPADGINALGQYAAYGANVTYWDVAKLMGGAWAGPGEDANLIETSEVALNGTTVTLVNAGELPPPTISGPIAPAPTTTGIDGPTSVQTPTATSFTPPSPSLTPTVTQPPTFTAVPSTETSPLPVAPSQLTATTFFSDSRTRIALLLLALIVVVYVVKRR